MLVHHPQWGAREVGESALVFQRLPRRTAPVLGRERRRDPVRAQNRSIAGPDRTMTQRPVHRSQLMDSKIPAGGYTNRIFNPYGLRPRALVLFHVLLVCLAIFTVDRIAAHAFRPGVDSKEIVLVSSRTCPHSNAVRKRLIDAGIPFREISAEAQPVSHALAAWAFQSFSVPIVAIGPEVIHGNRSDRIDEALAALGYDAVDDQPPPRSL
jgi:glutaredoxin